MTVGPRVWLYIAALAGCTDDLVDGVFTPGDWTKVQMLSPLPAVPPDTTNAFADDTRAATLGQRLFFDKDYSGAIVVGDNGTNGGLGNPGETGQVSCASCHVPSSWFSDTRSQPNNVSLAVGYTNRNTPPLVNAMFYDWYFWDGRKDSMWAQALAPSEAPTEMAGSRLAIAHVVFAKYRADYDAIFTPPLDPDLDPASAGAARFPATGKPGDAAWDTMAPADQAIVNRIFANFGKSLEAYERQLVSRNSPFDRYVAGDHHAITLSAKRGVDLFVGKAACHACHSSPFLSDNDFHCTGVAQTGPNVPATDSGRFDAVATVLADPFNSAGIYSDDTSVGRLAGLVQDESERGLFRTKDLRQVGETGPYMHDGSLATLDDVVAFYNAGGAPSGFEGNKDARIVPLNLSPAEAADLVAFLTTLTGDPIDPALLTDTSR